MRTVSLFSGIGGLDLGVEQAGFKTVMFCEQDAFCRAVLAKHWPNVPISRDVRELVALLQPLRRLPQHMRTRARMLRVYLSNIFAVVGGFPCQDVSVAGTGVGVEDGARSGLWREMRRVIAVVRPRWVIAENVPALRTRGADRVLGDLETIGYACWPLVVGVEHVGGPHKRHRVFIVAHRKGGGLGADRGARSGERHADGAGQGMADANLAGLRAGGQPQKTGVDGPSACICGFGTYAHYQAPECHRPQCPLALARSKRRQEPGSEQHWPHPPTPSSPGTPEVVNADSGRRGQQEPGRGQEGRAAARWPSGPDQPQHDWEAPRLVELPLGGAVDGLPVRLVRFANRNALKAFGNAVCPEVAKIIGLTVVRGNPVDGLSGPDN